MLWDARFVIGRLLDLRSKLGNSNLCTNEIGELLAVDRMVIWTDGYSKLDPRFHPYVPQFGAAAGWIRATARQLRLGNRALAKRCVGSALHILRPRDWFDRAA